MTTAIKHAGLVFVAILLALGAYTAVATTASADVDINTLNGFTVDGAPSNDARAGDSVEMCAVVELDDSLDEDLESISFDLIGDFVNRQKFDVPDKTQEGEYTVCGDFDIHEDTSEGTYDVRVTTHGIDGAGVDDRALDSTENDSATFSNRLTVEENGTSSGSDNNSDAVGSTVPAWFAAFMDKFDQFLNEEEEPENRKCSELQDKLAGTVSNTYNQANTRLQGFLLSEGMSIPALENGASFGFRGPQTNAAVNQFNATYQCG